MRSTAFDDRFCLVHGRAHPLVLTLDTYYSHGTIRVAAVMSEKHLYLSFLFVPLVVCVWSDHVAATEHWPPNWSSVDVCACVHS